MCIRIPDNYGRTLYLVAFCLLLFAGLLYLQMCIASLYDNYQFGIENVKLLLAPFWLVIVMIVLLLSFSQSRQLLTLATWFYRGALVVIGLLFVLMLIIDRLPTTNVWSYPHQHSLLTTIITSIMTPDFSGRSLAVLVSSLIMNIVLAILVEWRRYRAKKRLS